MRTTILMTVTVLVFWFMTGCRFGNPTSEPITVTITSPTNNATIPMGKVTQVVVMATAPNGVSRIELSVNGTLIAVSSNAEASSPYQAIINYTPLTTGPYNFIVRAYDKNNTASTPFGIALQAVLDSQTTETVTTSTPSQLTTTPMPTPTNVPGIPGPGGCILNAQFIADVTIPDGTTVPLGGAFTKTWRVRNTGTCVWDGTYKLLFTSGNQLNAPSSISLNLANPGDIIDVSVPMQAPASGTGSLTGEWRFAAPDNTIYGNKLTVVIALPNPTPTPTVPPPTPTPTPTITFSADATQIASGSCTRLRWSTSNVSAVALDGTGVPSPSEKQICPTSTTTYTLSITFNDNSSSTRQVVVSVTAGTILYSFADNASSAHWYNEISQTLTFGGPDTDSRGFAMNRDGTALEDNSLQLKVIETHPHWVSNGSIFGDFNVPTALQSGDRFRARVGFLKGANSGTVALRVWFKGTVIGELNKAYDGTLADWSIDLTPYNGQSGQFTLQVLGTPSVTQAWMCWINPRIER